MTANYITKKIKTLISKLFHKLLEVNVKDVYPMKSKPVASDISNYTQVP